MSAHCRRAVSGSSTSSASSTNASPVVISGGTRGRTPQRERPRVASFKVPKSLRVDYSTVPALTLSRVSNYPYLYILYSTLVLRYRAVEVRERRRVERALPQGRQRQQHQQREQHERLSGRHLRWNKRKDPPERTPESRVFQSPKITPRRLQYCTCAHSQSSL